MQLEEGQVFEGTISISGSDGPFRRWIVVAPFGKKHIHSIDDPMSLHCWPAYLVDIGLETGLLHFVGEHAEHPAIRVQRIKEALGIRDAHLGINNQYLDSLLEALRTAVAGDEEYALYLAGEILSAASHSAHLLNCQDEIVATVRAILDGDECRPIQGAVSKHGQIESTYPLA